MLGRLARLSCLQLLEPRTHQPCPPSEALDWALARLVLRPGRTFSRHVPRAEGMQSRRQRSPDASDGVEKSAMQPEPFGNLVARKLRNFWWEFHDPLHKEFRPLIWGGLEGMQTNSMTFERFLRSQRHPVKAFITIGGLGLRRTPVRHVEARTEAMKLCCARLSLMQQRVFAYDAPSRTSPPADWRSEYGVFVAGRSREEILEAGRCVGQSHVILHTAHEPFTIHPTSPAQEPATFQDRHGVTHEILITRHSRTRALIRYLLLRPDDPPPIDLDAWLHARLKRSQPRPPDNRKFEARLRRHGRDTVYLEDDIFTYVIQERNLVTVEIRRNHYRSLNKARLELGPDHSAPPSLLLAPTPGEEIEEDATQRTIWNLMIEVRLPDGNRRLVEISPFSAPSLPNEPPQRKPLLRHVRNAILRSKKQLPGFHESELLRVIGCVGNGRQRVLFEQSEADA